MKQTRRMSLVIVSIIVVVVGIGSRIVQKENRTLIGLIGLIFTDLFLSHEVT
jgi:hypothetical protein